MEIKLTSTGSNQHRVSIGDEIDLYFSYETVIAFSTEKTGLVTSENVWSNTTARHITAIDRGNKKDRIGHDEFKRQLDAIFSKIAAE